MGVHRWGKLLMLYPQCALDAGDRLELPPGVVQRMGDNPVLAPTLDLCLAIYTEPAWRLLTSRHQAMPEVRAEIRALLHAIEASAMGCHPDSKGLLTIPGGMKRLARIEDSVLLVSSSDLVQLWNPEVWAARQSDSPPVRQRHGVA